MNKTVITYGTFDLFHIGHLRLLKRLKNLGDELIVAVSTDEFNLLKGKKTIIPYSQRAEIVENIKFVDRVIPENSWDQKILDVKKYNVDIFAIGSDWQGKFDFLKDYCDVVYLDRTEGISSTELKKTLNMFSASKSNIISEKSPTGNTTNPYGRSKYFVEEILKDLYISDNEFKIAILRYFNPIGAHSSGLIGEDPRGVPNNLMPYITQTAIGKMEFLNIFGDDYDTKDGTGVRDYIHVVDLADGHAKAISYLNTHDNIKPLIVNLGTGVGYSVLDIVKSFESATGKKIKYRIKNRRDGDIAEYFADPQLAKELLSWSAKYNIHDMCEDSWRWQQKNPKGY